MNRRRLWVRFSVWDSLFGFLISDAIALGLQRYGIAGNEV